MAIVTVSRTEDYLLNFATNSYIEYKRVYSGNGLTFCSWMKLRDPYIAYFDSETENEDKSPFFGSIDFDENRIVCSGSDDDGNYAYTSVNDLLNIVTNYSTWFHVCNIRNESFLNFYVNGQPIQRYTKQEKLASLTKNIQLNIQIGSKYDDLQNGSFFQTNVFDRSITAKEVADMYNCKTVEGDLLSWSKIISKSQDVSFENNIFLVEGDVPCPTSSLNPNAAEAGMSNSRDPGSSSGNSDQGSSSGSSSQSPSSGSSNQVPSSGSSNQTPSSGSSNQVPSSGSSNQVPSSGSSNQGPSSGSSNQVPNSDNNEPGSSSKNSNQVSSSENAIPGSSSVK